MHTDGYLGDRRAIVVDHPPDVPATFIIEIKPGLYRWCRKVWLKNKEIGVEFTIRPSLIQTKASDGVGPNGD